MYACSVPCESYAIARYDVASFLPMFIHGVYTLLAVAGDVRFSNLMFL